MKWNKIRKYKGNPVKVSFDDHALNLPSCKCVVYGILEKIGRKDLTITHWDLLESPETREENKEFVTIVKTAVKEVSILSNLLTFIEG